MDFKIPINNFLIYIVFQHWYLVFSYWITILIKRAFSNQVAIYYWQLKL